jgi:putative transposase
LELIDEALALGESLGAICSVLEINRRSVYRWRRAIQLPAKHHGGGGGLNKLQPKEIRRVVAAARKEPQHRCRRIAYELERTGKAYVGKTKVAEIMKEHGLNHAFERRRVIPTRQPEDMLAHEPRAKNLVWGLDWTWVNVGGRFMYLTVLIDWYSRKILAHGLFHQITSFEVVAVITDAVAREAIDLLPQGALKPFVVADHGSANTSKLTKANIEIQGLKLWLSGVGRPTGNARTERVIGTLKCEEIKLQPMYASEDEASIRIHAAIIDYNHNRPNMGVGGHAPAIIHQLGRAKPKARREHNRRVTDKNRRKYWAGESR